MNNYELANSQQSMSLFVIFTFPDDLNANNSSILINRLLEQEFPKTCFEVRQYSEHGEREVIYKIQKPVLINSIELEAFYRRLLAVFVTLKSMKPRFAQYSNTSPAPL